MDESKYLGGGSFKTQHIEGGSSQDNNPNGNGGLAAAAAVLRVTHTKMEPGLKQHLFRILGV